MRWVIWSVLFAAAVGCSKKESGGDGYGASTPSARKREDSANLGAVAKSEDGDNDEELKKSAKDMAKYTAELKENVPIGPQEFIKAGFKADSYVKNDKYDNLFKEVVVRIDPVYLTDQITGLTARYSRARLILNNPRPYGPGRIAEPFAWRTIEMLP